MKRVKCSNNVKVCYQNIENSDFTHIEFWLMFGSKDDGLNKDGVAHIIEHLILSQNLSESDIYGFFHSYGYTNKERVRIYVEIHKSKAIDVLRSILNDIISFHIPDIIFKYQQAKVSFEIQKHCFSPIVTAFQAIEKMCLSGTGYEKLPIGRIEDIQGLTLEQTRNHLHKQIRQNGMIISIAGAVPDIESIVKVIEEEVFPLNDGRIWSNLEGRLFAQQQINSLELSKTQIILLNLRDSDLPPIDNFVCKNVLQTHFKYIFRNYPIETMEFNYGVLDTLVIYISNKSNNADRMISLVQDIFSEDMEKKFYQSITNCVYHEFLHMLQNNKDCAIYNATQMFLGTELSIDEVLNRIKDYSYDLYKQYLVHYQKKGRYVYIR